MKQFIVCIVICVVALTLPYCTTAPTKAPSSAKGKTVKPSSTAPEPTGTSPTVKECVVEGCANCSEQTGSECVTCKTGFWLNNTICNNCSVGCAKCETDTNCTTCLPGYTRNGSLCESNPTTTTPKEPTEIPTASPPKEKCPPGCHNCTGQTGDNCVVCLVNYVLNGTVCKNETSPTTTTMTTTMMTTMTVAKSSTTTAPPSQTTVKQSHHSCGFSTASFFGGMALAGGIAVIIFFGCKFYKARNMPSYHQF